MKGNMKKVYKHVNSKTKTRENIGPLLKGGGELVTKNMEKAKVSNATFALDLTIKTSLQEPPGPGDERKVCSKDNLPLVDEDELREYLNQLEISESTGPDRLHP